MRTDPFREFDRLAERLGDAGRPAVMSLDAYRDGNTFYVQFDLPGVDADSIDLTVERNVLTVKAERRGPDRDKVDVVVRERPRGHFTRQLFLGETLDTERLEAAYDAGVLTVRIPVAEQAKPRRIEVGGGSGSKEIAA